MPNVAFAPVMFADVSGTLTATLIIVVNEIFEANESLSDASTAGEISALGRTPTTKEMGGPRGARSVGVAKEQETTVPRGAEHSLLPPSAPSDTCRSPSAAGTALMSASIGSDSETSTFTVVPAGIVTVPVFVNWKVLCAVWDLETETGPEIS